MQTWNYRDRRPLPEGNQWPWCDEPDKAQWVDETTDLDCLAVRNHMGAWCGYVGIPPGHPWYDRNPYDIDVEVHGDLTYGSRCREDDPEPAICHVPAPGRPADVYWVGFDCAHGWDHIPRMEADLISSGVTDNRFIVALENYRTFDYVVDQCTRLADQVRLGANE